MTSQTNLTKTLSARPHCFEAYALTELSPENRIRLSRIQTAARKKQIETRIMNLSERLNELTRHEFGDGASDQVIIDELAGLDAEHEALTLVGALPDPELIEFLDEMAGMATADDVADEVMG